MFKDPVCNMMVDEKKAQRVSEVNGQKVYLCSPHCTVAKSKQIWILIINLSTRSHTFFTLVKTVP